MGLCEVGRELEDQETMRKGREITEEVPLCLSEVSSVLFDRQKEENMNYSYCSQNLVHGCLMIKSSGDGLPA